MFNGYYDFMNYNISDKHLKSYFPDDYKCFYLKETENVFCFFSVINTHKNRNKKSYLTFELNLYDH